ncbi:hypothetical protein HDV63DRAFT_388466 [Trichoderma sp. SZMC 28014]
MQKARHVIASSIGQRECSADISVSKYMYGARSWLEEGSRKALREVQKAPAGPTRPLCLLKRVQFGVFPVKARSVRSRALAGYTIDELLRYTLRAPGFKDICCTSMKGTEVFPKARQSLGNLLVP